MSIGVYASEPDSWEAKRIVAEADLLGEDATYFDYKNISLQQNGAKVDVLYGGKEIKLPAIGIFRSARDMVDGHEYREKAFIIRDEIHKTGYVLNYQGIQKFPFGKLWQGYRLAQEGIPTVSGQTASTPAEAHTFLKKYGQVVVKPISGSSGDGVTLIETPQQMDVQIAQHELSTVIFQEVLAIGHDYRVLVLGGKALGVMERRAQKGAFVANFSKGAEIMSARLTPPELEIAYRAVKVFGLEYAGVDLIRDMHGKLRVLEINRFAQFRGFEKATGVNVAKLIVEYCRKQITL